MLRSLPALLPALLLVLAGCGGDGPASPEATVADLTVTPSAVSIGSPIEIRGLDPSTLDASGLVVRVDGQETFARIAGDATLLATVPIFTDEAGLAPLPTDPVDVEVLSDGVRVGFAGAALAVSMPPSAPGATRDVATAMLSIVDAVDAVTQILAPTPSPEDGYVSAVFGALDELIAGEDPASLTSQLAALEADDEETLALLDGILAASGVLERVEIVAGLLDDLAVATTDLRTPALGRRASTIDQYDLAARMQLYVMVRDVGQQVIGQTAADWGAFVGPVLGGIGFVGGVPGIGAAGTVGTILGVLNTGVNTIALSLLPSEIVSFDLEVDEPFVAPGEVAATEIWITARTRPSPLTTLDLVDLVLNLIGNAGGSGGVPSGHPYRNALIQTVDYFLGIFRGLLSGYAQQHPDSDFAFDLELIPQFTYRALVTDTRFVSPRSLTPDVIDANGNDILAWRAATNTTGEGRIYAQIENGPEVTSLVQLPGYTYNAGAFGDDPRASETQTVVVAAPLFLTASMDPAISPGGTNGLEVRAGTVTATGDTLYLEGVSIACTANGGSVSPAGGTTGVDGRFDTFVTLDAGSVGVTVDVVGTDPVGQTAAATAGATSEEQLVVSIELPERVGADEDVPVVVTAQLLTQQGFVPAEGAEISVTGENGSDVAERSGVADASGVFTTTARIDPGENELVISAEADYATLDRAETEERALREDSIEIASVSAIHFSEVFATWSSEDGIPWTRFISEFDIEEFTEIVPSISSTTSATGQGSAGGMAVTGDADTSIDVDIDLDGDGGFRAVRLDGASSTSMTVSSPPERRYQCQTDATVELRVELRVWGTAATWSFSGSSSTERVDVEIEGGSDVGDLVDCYSEDGACSSLSGGGPLPVGEYDVDIQVVDATFFSDLEGARPSGTESESGTFSFEFTARH